MILDSRQLKVGFVKNKDPSLCKEINSNLALLGEHTTPRSIDCWNHVYNDLLRPNKLLSSTMKDEDGWNMFHHIVTFSHVPEYIIDFILDINPKVIQTKTDTGDLPFYIALVFKRQQSPTIVLKLLRAFPQAAKQQDSDGFYPLHRLLSCDYYKQSTVVVFRAILHEFPQAATLDNNKYGMYPLHVSCFYAQSETIVQELIKVCPEAVRSKDSYGRYPLFYAYTSNQNEIVIQELITLFPEAAKQKDMYGMYPLHTALKSCKSETIVQELIKIFPEAVQSKDNNGLYPLFYAYTSKQSKVIIQELIEMFPEANEQHEEDESEYYY